MDMKAISARTWCANQSWKHERVFKDKKHTLRVTIVRNAYDEQSHGIVHRWSGEKWFHVNSLPIEYLTCRHISYVQKDVTNDQFDWDAKLLLRDALAVIS